MQRVYATDREGRRYYQLDDFMLSLRQVTHCEKSYSCSITVPVDMSDALTFAKTQRERITVTAMIVRASALALENHPILAGRWLDRVDRIFVPGKGEVKMFLPVQVGDFSDGVWIYGTSRKSLVEIAKELNKRTLEIKEKKAVESQLFHAEPFFTVSNIGTLGVVEDCSALLTGEVVSQLVVCSIIDKPWVVGGRIETRKIMNLVMLWDHFAVLASTPAEFLTDVKRILESPERLQMQIGKEK